MRVLPEACRAGVWGEEFHTDSGGLGGGGGNCRRRNLSKKLLLRML